jgi:hypothetical protein
MSKLEKAENKEMFEVIWRDMEKTPIDVGMIERQPEQGSNRKNIKDPYIHAPIPLTLGMHSCSSNVSPPSLVLRQRNS